MNKFESLATGSLVQVINQYMVGGVQVIRFSAPTTVPRGAWTAKKRFANLLEQAVKKGLKVEHSEVLKSQFVQGQWVEVVEVEFSA